MGVAPWSSAFRIPRWLCERLTEFSRGLPSLFERLGISTLHRTDFPTVDGGADLNEFTPDSADPPVGVERAICVAISVCQRSEGDECGAADRLPHDRRISDPQGRLASAARASAAP
jgi:hypothetical protein